MKAVQTGETAMHAAFAKAGYQFKSKEPPDTPKQRLEAMMALAIGSGGGLQDPSVDNFIKKLLAEDDAQLVWTLFEDVRLPVVRRFFEMILFHIRQQNPDLQQKPPRRPQGQSRSDTHDGRAAEPPGGGRAPPAIRDVKPSERLPAVPAAPQPARDPTLAVGEAISRTTQLDRIRINGVALGDLGVPDQVAQIKTMRGREARFIALLVSQITPGIRAKRLRDVINQDQADSIWAKTIELDNAPCRPGDV
jgi:hypothetical protein